MSCGCSAHKLSAPSPASFFVAFVVSVSRIAGDLLPCFAACVVSMSVPDWLDGRSVPAFVSVRSIVMVTASSVEGGARSLDAAASLARWLVALGVAWVRSHEERCLSRRNQRKRFYAPSHTSHPSHHISLSLSALSLGMPPLHTILLTSLTFLM